MSVAMGESLTGQLRSEYNPADLLTKMVTSHKRKLFVSLILYDIYMMSIHNNWQVSSFSDLAKLFHDLCMTLFLRTGKILPIILFEFRGDEKRLPEDVASVHVLSDNWQRRCQSSDISCRSASQYLGGENSLIVAFEFDKNPEVDDYQNKHNSNFYYK